MEILLAKPIISTYYVISPNLGLGYLARIAHDQGHEVRILDPGQADLTWEGFRDIVRERRFGLIGLQCFTHEVLSVQQHVSIIREESPDTFVVIGGPHPSALPAESLVSTGADFAFPCEAERGLEALIRIPRDRWKQPDALQTVPNLWALDPEGNPCVSNEPSFVGELDSIPFPLWEKMDPNTYPLKPHGTFCRQKPIAPMIVSRGCPFHCTFCGGHTVTGRKIRYRSVENVLEEVMLLHERFGVREIHIEDDNFTLNREIVEGLCRELIRRDLRLSLSCPNGVRLDSLDPDLIRLMEKAGFYSLAVGIEFGTNKLLKLSKKSLTVEKITEQVSMIKKHSRIQLTGFFLLGHPEETLEDMQETMRFSRRLSLDKASFMPLMPLPGSEIWDRWEGKNQIGSDGWDKFFYYRTINISTIPDETLGKLQKRAMLFFYLRPRVMLHLFRELLSWQQIKVVAQRLTHMFARRDNIKRNA